MINALDPPLKVFVALFNFSVECERPIPRRPRWRVGCAELGRRERADSQCCSVAVATANSQPEMELGNPWSVRASGPLQAPHQEPAIYV